jgi:hypothetical protein
MNGDSDVSISVDNETGRLSNNAFEVPDFLDIWHALLLTDPNRLRSLISLETFSDVAVAADLLMHLLHLAKDRL